MIMFVKLLLILLTVMQILSLLIMIKMSLVCLWLVLSARISKLCSSKYLWTREFCVSGRPSLDSSDHMPGSSLKRILDTTEQFFQGSLLSFFKNYERNH